MTRRAWWRSPATRQRAFARGAKHELGEADQFIAAWEKSRDFMQSQPGYVGAALHQAVTLVSLMPAAAA